MIFSKICKLLGALTLVVSLGTGTLSAMNPCPCQCPQTIVTQAAPISPTDVFVACAKPCVELTCAGCTSCTIVGCCEFCGAYCAFQGVEKMLSQRIEEMLSQSGRRERLYNNTCCCVCSLFLTNPMICTDTCCNYETENPYYSLICGGCAIGCCIDGIKQTFQLYKASKE